MSDTNFPPLGGSPERKLGEKVMVIQRTDIGKTLTELSPFLIEKVISSYCGEVKQTRKNKDGNILVTVKNEKQENNLKKLTKFCDGVNVKVYEHTKLNSCRAVVVCKDVSSESDGQILKQLEKQGVTAVKQIMKKKNDQLVPTGTFILTFGSAKPPKDIKIGYIKVNIKPYYPNPLRCYKCLKFGHLSSTCTSSKKCSKCGEDFHENCTKEEKCINCAEKHNSFFIGCKKLKEEKQIMKIKVDRNIPFWEARKLVQSENKESFASVVRKDIEKKFEEKMQKNQEEFNKIIHQYENQLKNLEKQYDELNKNLSEVVELNKVERDQNKKLTGKYEKLYEYAKKLENKVKQLQKNPTTLKPTKKIEEENTTDAEDNATKVTRSTRQREEFLSPPRKKPTTEMKPSKIAVIPSDSESDLDFLEMKQRAAEWIQKI